MNKYLVLFLSACLLLQTPNVIGNTLQDEFVNESSESEVWIHSGSRRIYGVLSHPKSVKGKCPLVIIAHGFNGTHHFGKNYFKPLNDMGYQCFSFDFPCGSVNSRSDNNTMEMSVLDEVNDLKTIIRYFKETPNTDVSDIVVIGESQGGLVAALTASEMRKEIKKLILVYPALCIPDNWNSRYQDVAAIPDTTRLWNVPMGKRFFMELRDMKVFDAIAKFKRPVLIIQGDADRIVSLEDSRRAVELYKKAHLHIIPNAGHGFKPHEFRESVEQIQHFLNNH